MFEEKIWKQSKGDRNVMKTIIEIKKGEKRVPKERNETVVLTTTLQRSQC